MAIIEKDYAKRKETAKQAIRKIIPTPFSEFRSGIYLYWRTDSNGISWFYCGQAQNIYSRQIGHYCGLTTRIDISLKKRGFYSDENPYGWKFAVIEHCEESQLDEREKFWILHYMKKGVQSYNITDGGQNKGKGEAKEYKEAKGYRQGVANSYERGIAFVKNFFTKYLNFSPKNQNKVTLRKFEEFKELINNG